MTELLKIGEKVEVSVFEDSPVRLPLIEKYKEAVDINPLIVDIEEIEASVEIDADCVAETQVLGEENALTDDTIEAEIVFETVLLVEIE